MAGMGKENTVAAIAYQLSKSIASVVRDIYHNNYVLPFFQREYIWSPEEIETLFDSLMRGYPIGTFLFWKISNESREKYEFYEFVKEYREDCNNAQKKVDLKGLEEITAVIDGQQRLTSIYLGLKGTYAKRLKYKRRVERDSYPKMELYLDLLSQPGTDDKNNYAFKFLTNDKADKYNENNKNKYWFRVGDILDITDLDTYLNDKINDQNCPKEKQESAANILKKLYNVIKEGRTISYYIENTDDLDRILKIFVRVNSGGKKLSYSDLLLSIASAQWEKLNARDEISGLVNEVNDKGFHINKDFVLKAALVLDDKDVAFKVANFDKQNMKAIESSWTDIRKSIILTAELVKSFGYSRDILTSNNAMIPIAYYLKKIGNPENYVKSSNTARSRENIRKWLVRSLLKKVFSSQTDFVLGKLRDIINKNVNRKDDVFPLDNIIGEFNGKSKSIQFSHDDIDRLVKLNFEKNDKADTRSVLLLLYSPNSDYKFDIDHIYPKSKLQKKEYLLAKGVAEKDLEEYRNSANNICNLQLINELANKEKSNSDFDQWFEKTQDTDEKKEQYRGIHLLPKMDYTYPNFLDFLEQRREKINKKLKELLQ